MEQNQQNPDSVGKVAGFFLFRNLINNYNETKSCEMERKSCKRYGVNSIILSMIALVLSIGSIITNRAGILVMTGFSSITLYILVIVGGCIISALFGIYAMIFSIMQVRLNRKAVGIIAIILSVISLLGSVGVLVFIFI